MPKFLLSKPVNVVAFNLTWLGCVVGRESYWWAFAPVVAGYLTLLVQYRIFRVRQFLMLFGLGVSIDSLLTVLGVFQFGPTLFFIPLWLVLLWAAFALLGALHNPAGRGGSVYAGLCLASAWGGGLVAARHVWLQHLPEDQVPACGPPLDYLLENFPLQEAINTLLMGDGNCAETMWTFMGLTIPEQTLLVFVAAMVISFWQMVRSLR